VSPPVAVPAGAQTLTVAARSANGGALLEVRAQPEEGGPVVVLGTVEPAGAASSSALGVAALAGRTVRLVLDPIPALGGSVDVLSAGPFTAPLPGWSLARGAMAVREGRPGRRLAVTEPLEVTSPSFRPGPAARELLVAARGDGILRADAGRRHAALRAGTAWRDLHVRVGSGRTRLRLTATPGPGGLELRDLGVVRRATLVRSPRILRSGRGARVTARLLPAGGRLRVSILGDRGRRIASGLSDAGGRVRIAVPVSARPRFLVVPGDRTRAPARAAVRSRPRSPARRPRSLPR
jgi:hypothetical protein